MLVKSSKLTKNWANLSYLSNRRHPPPLDFLQTYKSKQRYDIQRARQQQGLVKVSRISHTSTELDRQKCGDEGPSTDGTTTCESSTVPRKKQKNTEHIFFVKAGPSSAFQKSLKLESISS